MSVAALDAGKQRQQQCCFAVAGAGCTRLGEQKREKLVTIDRAAVQRNSYKVADEDREANRERRQNLKKPNMTIQQE